MKRISTRAWAAVLAAVTVLGAAFVVAQKRSDPAVAWLDGAGPARWIVYPSPGSTTPRRIVALDATFARSFHLDRVPSSAVLRCRAFREGVVRINGRDAAALGGPDWKTERSVEVGALLRGGENRIEARVSNAAGPPALWLALELPGGAVVSDEGWTSSWAGATPRPAARATEPRSSRMLDPDVRVMPAASALALEWRRMLAFSLVPVLVVGLVALLRRRRPGWPLWSPGSPWPVRLATGLVSLLWVALFVNDSPFLPLSQGFDAAAHLEYARFIHERRALPFADDGWQMFQPPLYYLLLAAGSALAGVPPVDPDATIVVRGLGLVIGLAHLALLGASMRLVFPQQPGRQIAGLAIGGFLPCMLYLHQYPANEPLVAMLSSAAILAALHALRRGEPGLAIHAAVGLLLGLALLAKASALLLLPPILGALIVRAVRGDPRGRPRRVSAVALSAATAILTCGWYYARVWERFGTPFVGGWDPRRGMGWWADPGYRTFEDFLRFGRAFTSPLFAGFGGFWDGLYVTLWGDGLLSGRHSVALLPPWWSPSLMSAALLLASVPALAILAGGVAAARRWIRDPDATTGLLVWLALAVLASLVLMAVAVPAIAADKASYGLLALVPLCAFGARALGLAAARWRWMGPVLASAVGLWALTSFATYWIDASSAKARLVKGAIEADGGDRALGLALMRDALASDPADWSSRVLLAGYLLQEDGPRAEVARLLAPDAQVPGLAVRHVALAILAIRQGDAPRAQAALRRAVAADPDSLQAHHQLAALAAAAGDLEGAVGELREVLRIDPQHHPSHAALSDLYRRLGDVRSAAMHQAWAARLEPGT